MLLRTVSIDIPRTVTVAPALIQMISPHKFYLSKAREGKFTL
jgi:hypothetical protein